MTERQSDDKRRVARAALTTFCPATFSHGGAEHHGLMLNISEHGAGFQIDDPKHDPGLREGDAVSITVRTPYGEGICEGTVIWARKLLGRVSWGIAFTKLSDDPQDPIRALIEAPF